ncbi:adenosine deaminase-like [Leptinotarsa decemlineata]|uniref:adenosine deaminase-like n=1 Tax=Leptinotarsa decemlineata TaxID=7539 RepID=UPI003D30BF68
MRRAFEVLFLLAMCLSSTQADYWTDRAALLNEKEREVNELLKTYKYQEYDTGFAHPESFLAAQYFFQAEEGIEQSKVFKLIKKLPKGASLHSDDLALVSQEFLFNLTYRDNLYACLSEEKLKLHFFDNKNNGVDCMPLSSFVPQLEEMKLKYGATFFFHAGETNWYGESTDFNLFDAILLNTTRIGHGYALLKHPLAMKMIKEKNIAVEICPISNQVLKLVDDIRNHPGAILIANNFPVVVASDDPSVWGAKGLSYDWYYAFMGMTSRESDLRFLQQLAKNSIEFSTFDEEVYVSDMEQNVAVFVH